MEDQPTPVLDRTTRVQSREPEFVYRRRRLGAAIAGGIFFVLLIVLILGMGGNDPAPKSTPSDLGVGGGPSITTPSTDRSNADKKTDTTGDTSGGTVAPTTPPATGDTGG